MKTVTVSEAQSRLDELFNEAQSRSPVLLVRGDELAKLERVEPPGFGGGRRALEDMLSDAVRGPHQDWTPEDLEDIARRVRARRSE